MSDESTLSKLVNAKTKRPDPDEVISRHRYQRDSQSGAGNCWCGRHEAHQMHQWSVQRDYQLDGGKDRP